MMKKIGQRVKILPVGGMREFYGTTGAISDIERDGPRRMYSAALDAPIDIAGVGAVCDDLWKGRALRAPRR